VTLRISEIVMDEPSNAPSNLPILAALLFAVAVTLACLTSWLGPAMIWLVIAAGLAVALGGFHYWLWGRDMQARDEDADAGP
jgi:hypothetical protein